MEEQQQRRALAASQQVATFGACKDRPTTIAAELSGDASEKDGKRAASGGANAPTTRPRPCGAPGRRARALSRVCEESQAAEHARETKRVAALRARRMRLEDEWRVVKLGSVEEKRELQ